MTGQNRRKPSFDKYFYYTESVQSPEHDAKLIQRMFRNNSPTRRRKSVHLQEDFCATAALCYEWVKLEKSHTAVGLDIDAEALSWGRHHHGVGLSPGDLSRLQTLTKDVFTSKHSKSDIICALNFSYSFIHTREKFKQYASQSLQSLSKGGLFVLDAFGGPEYQVPHSDRRRDAQNKFTFWWDVETFDAITSRIICHLHFKRDGEKIRKRVFTYEWRLWSVAEITDILHEVGFSKVEYWTEGTTRDGYGNGRFSPAKHEPDCESWVAYIVAQK
jgi:hypothetical protein